MYNSPLSIMIIFIYLPIIREWSFELCVFQWIIYLLPLYMDCCFRNNHQQLALITRVNVQACSKFIQTSFAILQMVIGTSGFTMSVQGSNSTCTYYKDPNQGSHLYKDHINLYIYQDQVSYQNFKSIVFIFSP